MKKCVGSVVFASNEGVLNCSYCNTFYNDFVKIEDASFNSLIEKVEIYSYSCAGCDLNLFLMET